MTSWWTRWRLKSPDSRLFNQPFIQAQIKENIKALCHWPFRGEFTGDLTGEFPAQMESNADNVSIIWRHHDCVSSSQWYYYSVMINTRVGHCKQHFTPEESTNVTHWATYGWRYFDARQHPTKFSIFVLGNCSMANSNEYRARQTNVQVWSSFPNESNAYILKRICDGKGALKQTGTLEVPWTGQITMTS